MKNYLITCEECQETRRISIVPTAVGQRIDWLDDDPNEKIVSGRERLDGQFGWQCLCGNNTLLTTQESKEITNKVNPDPKQIKEVIDNLRPEPTRFKMEVA